MLRKFLRKLFPPPPLEDRPLAEQVAFLRKEVADLRGILGDHRSVDLVDFRDIKVFMFTDDFGYERQVLECCKHYQPVESDLRRAAERRAACRAPETAAQPLEALFCRANEGHVIRRVLSHYWKHGLDFVYLDIGCGYGISALSAALAIYSAGRSNRVVCFEPGVAGTLAEHNFALNGMEECISFEPLAAAGATCPVILCCESGQTQGNRIVNRRPDEEARSYVVRAVSIDDYARDKGICENLIVKIDTEGAEYEVLSGMKRVMAERCVTCFVEFSPYALSTRIPPERFLAATGEQAHILDIGTLEFDITLPSKTPFRLVGPSEYARFSAEVASPKRIWADLLVIPKKLPGVEELLGVLT